MVVLGYLTPPVVLDHPRLVVAGRAGSDDTFTRELVVRVTHDSYPAIMSTSDTRTFEYGGPSIDELQNSGSELAILGSNFGTIGRWAWGRVPILGSNFGTIGGRWAWGRVPVVILEPWRLGGFRNAHILGGSQ